MTCARGCAGLSGRIEIVRRLDRHKSWVCRRLVLVEALDLAVQADVRLALVAPCAAIALAALPRGNQVPAAAVVICRGLTVAQTERLVTELIAQLEEACAGGWRSGSRPPRPTARGTDAHATR